MSERKLMGLQASFFHGVFDGCFITATRYAAIESGQIEWVAPLSGESGEYPIYKYLVIDGQFQKVNTVELHLSLGRTLIDFDEVIEEPLDTKHQAILKAIARWEPVHA